MTKAQDLQAEWEAAEQEAFELQRKRDEGITMLKEQYNEPLVAARARAAEAQKAAADAAAAEALVGRPDAENLAQALGLELPESA